MHPIQPEEIRSFRRQVYRYFENHGRVLPWRRDFNPYHIFVSEVMLQQTQVDRVIDKFNAFIERFPDIATLSASSLEAVLAQWQGLGYNRRAAALREAAKRIVYSYNGIIPNDPDTLCSLPGIGPATAASIVVFAFNQPMVFLETNIRTVFIHHFIHNRELIDDVTILPLAEAALDRRNPRKWYSALMDYGTMLKRSVGNLSRNSTTYKKQSPFIGSRRQMRGAIIKLLLKYRRATYQSIARELKKDKTTVANSLNQMTNEGLLKKDRRWYLIAS